MTYSDDRLLVARAKEQAEVLALSCALAYAFGRALPVQSFDAFAKLGFFSDARWVAFAQEAYDIGVRSIGPDREQKAGVI